MESIYDRDYLCYQSSVNVLRMNALVNCVTRGQTLQLSLDFRLQRQVFNNLTSDQQPLLISRFSLNYLLSSFLLVFTNFCESLYI